MNKKTIIIVPLAMLLAPVGMEAKKKVKEPVVPQLMNYPSAEVSEYRLHGGNVVIKGQIAGREGDETLPQEILDQLNGRFTVIMRNYIVRKEKTSVIEFKPDGTFSMNVYVPYPRLCSSILWERYMPARAILSASPSTPPSARRKRASPSVVQALAAKSPDCIR